MNIVSERMKKILQTLNIQSISMATELGIKKSAMSAITNGRVKELSGSVVELLRLKYNINPVWLQTGEGEMFLSGALTKASSNLAYTDEDLIRIPVLGSIAAGKPGGSTEHDGEYLTFPRSLFDTRYDVIAVQLVSAHLDPNQLDLKIGDICFFEKCPLTVCEPGNVVVSKINGHFVTGIFNVTPEYIMIMPKDDRFPVYKVDWDDQANVLGRMVAIFRKK